MSVVQLCWRAIRAGSRRGRGLDQIAALPLGSRIRVDPWTNRIALLQAKPVSLLSARDKLPFEITPFMIPLARMEAQPSGSR